MMFGCFKLLNRDELIFLLSTLFNTAEIYMQDDLIINTTLHIKKIL